MQGGAQPADTVRVSRYTWFESNYAISNCEAALQSWPKSLYLGALNITDKLQQVDAKSRVCVTGVVASSQQRL